MSLRPQTPTLSERRAAEQKVFVREVDEAVRQDEMSGFVKRFGLPILALVVIALLALGGYLWWQHRTRVQTGERGEALVKALDQVKAGRFDAGDKALAPIAAQGGSGSAAAAQMMRGAIAEEQGKSAEAARLFAALAADGDAPRPFRDLATIREVAVRFDAMPPQQVIDRLKPLAVPGNPWFGSAGELVGMAYLKQGQRELAGPMFASIARDDKTPQSLRRRARQLAGLLGVDAVDDVARAISDADRDDAGQ